jgi:hypothetical protein
VGGRWHEATPGGRAGSFGQTPLHIAARAGRQQRTLVRLLLEHGADHTLRDTPGEDRPRGRAMTAMTARARGGMTAREVAEEYRCGEVAAGLGRIVALHCRPFALHQIR